MPNPTNLGLVRLIEAHINGDGTHPTTYEPLSLTRIATTASPTYIVQEPALCVIAQGRKRILVGDGALTYDADHYLLASLDLPVAGEILEASPGSPYLALRLALTPAMVVDVATDQPGGASSGLGLTVNPLDASLRNALERLLGLLEEPQHLSALAPLVHREIVYRLLAGPCGAQLRDYALSGGAFGMVSQAIATLRRDFAQPLRIVELCRELGVSESGFYHHFKALTAMSPLQFQKRLRIQEARRLMLSEGEDASGAAFRVGYESPSQFSREYRRLFGAPPARDSENLRGRLHKVT